MLRCIVRQSFANRTIKLLKLEVAVEQSRRAKLEKNNCNHGWHYKKLMMWNGVYPDIFSLVWLGIKV